LLSLRKSVDIQSRAQSFSQPFGSPKRSTNAVV
jgi:hypothetical protein